MAYDATKKTFITRDPQAFGASEGPIYREFTATGNSPAFKLAPGKHNLHLSGVGVVGLQRTPFGEDPSAYPGGSRPWYDCTDGAGNLISFTASGSVSPSIVFEEPGTGYYYRFVCTAVTGSVIAVIDS